MRWRGLLCTAVLFAPSVSTADEPLPLAPTQAPPAPTLPPASPSTLGDKTAVLTGEYIAPSRPDFVFGMDLLLGQQSGIRPSVGFAMSERSSFVIEGFYGGLLTKFGSAEGGGAGVRWVTTRGGRDSVTVGPGVDLFFNFNRGQATFLAPTVDVAWTHCFGERAALMLGINAGLGVGVSGNRNNDHDDPVSGRVTPLISLYSGLRY